MSKPTALSNDDSVTPPAAMASVGLTVDFPGFGEVVGKVFTAEGSTAAGATVTLTLKFTDPPPSGVTYGPYSVVADNNGDWSYTFTINEAHSASGKLTVTSGTSSVTITNIGVIIAIPTGIDDAESE
ncbi:MAG TPA: hypothetical protein VGJ05_22285 [Fimbriiglobus sp.]|jgi:hypothetical protein